MSSETIIAMLGIVLAGAGLLFGDGWLRRKRGERRQRSIEHLRLPPGASFQIEEVDPAFVTIIVTVMLCISAIVIVAIIHDGNSSSPPSAENALSAPETQKAPGH